MVSHSLAEASTGVSIQHWLILGPFVVQTEGHFEREYLYERQRILDIDYLAHEGGEAQVRPKLGQQHENSGLGPKSLTWRDWPHADLRGLEIAGDALYETVQRNCVIYAAAVIDADHDTAALLEAQHSGMKVWLNGELIANEPYGLPKGVRLTMPPKLMRLNKGNNLLVVKFRPGYIADQVNFVVRNVTVSPMVAQKGTPLALGRMRATPYFTGTLEAPRQIIEAVVVNTSHSELKVIATLECEDLESKDQQELLLAPEEGAPLRLSVATPSDAANRHVNATYALHVYGKSVETSLRYQTGFAPEHDGTVMMLTSFHFDTTYVQEQRVYAMGAFDIVRRYCELHRADPLFRSTLSEIDYLKPYFDVFPEDRATLLKVFRENRSNSDVMYNQPNEMTCGDEALVRNFLYGQLFHGKVLGQICHVYGPGDVFGHPNQLSQIARKSGCIGITWDKHIFNFPPFFRHLSLDGSTLPHKRGEPTWAESREMGLSIITGEADQTPPTEWHETLIPRVQQATYYDLISHIEEEVEAMGAHLPLTSRDMSLYHAATSMSRTNLKIANRLGENLLTTAEKFATVAAWLGAAYPEKALDKAWRQLLCGQHHDSITGTHNEISYIDLMHSYREVLELGQDVLGRALDYIGESIDARGMDYPVSVFNPLAFERNDVVEALIEPEGMKSFTLRDDKGKRVRFETLAVDRDNLGRIHSARIRFFAKKVPSLGYRTYAVRASDRPLPERSTHPGTIIENEYYSIEADPNRGGGLISLFDKDAKREVLNSGDGHVGNEIAVLDEVPDREETQHEFYTTGLAMYSHQQPATVEVESGPISSTLRIRYDFVELCEVVQEITLYKGVKRIEFNTVLNDVQGEDKLFCVTFPTNLRGTLPVFDERFGAVVRNDSRGYLDFRTHQMLMFSDCAVYGANKWMEFGSSASLRMGSNSYALGMIGLITPKNVTDIAAGETIQRVLVKKGITCTPWHDTEGPTWGSYMRHRDEDLLYTRFRISLGAGGRNAYSKGLIDKQKKSSRAAFEKQLKKCGYAFLFVKDNDLRDKNWPAMPVLIIEAKTDEDLTKAVHELLEKFDEKAEIRLPKSVDVSESKNAVDDYGVALLNEGTYANSIEKGGTICMMLAHTCRWYGGTNNFDEGYLVPENKNHVFRYALYPHAGDWRAAATHRAAYEYNHPLIARAIQPAPEPALPARQAFLNVDKENVLVTAMKPVGNPLASLERNALANPENGIMIRLYDGHGEDSSVRVTFARPVTRAWSANLLEEKIEDLEVRKGRATVAVPAFSIETVVMVPEKAEQKRLTRVLGPEAEIVQPVWVRSWEHDAESLPMGYGAVTCTLGRDIDLHDEGRTVVVKVNAVNDYTDSTIDGKAELILPEGWQAGKASVSFSLPPLGHQITPVRLTRPSDDACGLIKLRHEFDGQVFQDVLEVGKAYDLEMMVENRETAIVVTVANPHEAPVEGEVSIVSPLETWGTSVAGSYALATIHPRTMAVTLAPGETRDYAFSVNHHGGPTAPKASYWAVARLISNGRMQLKRCDHRPPRRLMTAEKWWNQYREQALDL